MDNRPQTFDEFLSITPQLVFVSATPGEYERTRSQRIVEQIVRPTGVVDPEIDVRETKNQIDDLMNEIRRRVDVDERVLVTTLTKKMSEDLSQYLIEMGFKVRYLHSEIDTLERIQIIRDLRLGEYDVLVGVNLLREGLDLPEVSLVAILDADKEGFLRGETSLIQTIGRAARNVKGTVLMYADKETKAMKAAIEETYTAAGNPTAVQRGSRDHRVEHREGHIRYRGVPAVGVQGAKGQASAQHGQGEGERDAPARAGAHGGGARGGDDRRGRRPALRVRRTAARRDQRAAPRAQRRASFRGPGGDGSVQKSRRTGTWPTRSRLARLPRARWHRMSAVDLDRQQIERRDFPIIRRGYDPATVDAHLRALSAEVEELQREASSRGQESLASVAGTQVQGILEAAQASAMEIERAAAEDAQRVRDEANAEALRAREEAIARAQAHVAAVAKAAEALLGRVGTMDTETRTLIDSLRSGAGRLVGDLEAGAGDGELYYAAERDAPRRGWRRVVPPQGRRPAAQPLSTPAAVEEASRRIRADRSPHRATTAGPSPTWRGHSATAARRRVLSRQAKRQPSSRRRRLSLRRRPAGGSRRCSAGGAQHGPKRRLARGDRALFG